MAALLTTFVEEKENADKMIKGFTKSGMILIYNQPNKMKDGFKKKLFDEFIEMFEKNGMRLEITYDELIDIIFRLSSLSCNNNSDMGKFNEKYYPTLFGASTVITYDHQIKVMSWNIMGNSMYSSEQKFNNLHGFADTEYQITPAIKRDRIRKIKEICSSVDPDILMIQKANINDGSFSNLPNWMEDGGAIGNLTSYIKINGAKCRVDENNKTKVKNVINQSDSTTVHYNKYRFTLIDHKCGCFMDRKEKKGSGTGFNIVILRDARTHARLFIINIHVKIADWGDAEQTIDWLIDEVNLYIAPWINDREPTPRDSLIMGGDFNACSVNKIFNNNEEKTTHPDLRGYDDIVRRLRDIDLFRCKKYN